MERDDLMLEMKTEKVISTHTLTWSVTVGLTLAPISVNISTHTLTWSVTAINTMSD